MPPPTHTRPEAVLVGQRIQEARKAAGLTQAELAARLRTTQPYVSRVERGDYVPSVPQLWAWAEALGVERGRLIGDEPIVADPRDGKNVA